MSQQEQVAYPDLRERHRARRDVATVISMLPYPVDERKPGLVPGIFTMKPANKNDCELLVVERCIHAVYLDETRPRLIVPAPSGLVAESIVLDHKRSIQGYVPNWAEPAIEWVPGEFTNDENGKKMLAGMHGAILKDMIIKQQRWFESLVQFADDDWAKYKQHKFITRLQRDAAMTLGLEREWLMAKEVAAAASKCKFCFSMVHPDAIVCATCHGVLDLKTYEQQFIRAGGAPPQATTAAPKTT
jgi:hypothetical protein